MRFRIAQWQLAVLMSVVCLAIRLSDVAAAVITQRHSVRPAPAFPEGPESIDVNGDGLADLTFEAGPYYCTLDVPTSACGTSIAILGNEDVDFFWQAAAVQDQLKPLEIGTWLGPDTVGGVWAPGESNRASVSMSQNFRRETVTFNPQPLPDDNFLRIGFRTLADDSYRYGWLDVMLYSMAPQLDVTPEPPVARPIGQGTRFQLVRSSFESNVGQSVRVNAVPEPRGLWLVGLAVGSCVLCWWRHVDCRVI